MKKFLLIVLVIQFISLFLYKRENTFISDSLLKAIQGVSLIEHGTEEIFYPAKNLDPNYSLFIYEGGFSKEVNKKYIGQYPVFFSVFSGVLLRLPLIFISFFSILLLGLTILFLEKKTSYGYYYLFLYFTSSIINNSFYDLNEASLFFLFNALGFGFIISFFKSKNFMEAFIGLFLITFSTWLRLESILFYFSITIMLFYTLERKNWFKIFTISILALTPLFLFFAFNLSNYGHFLGPRYFFNFSPDFNLSTKLIRIISMSLFYFDKTGLKLGLFFVMPILLLAVYQSFKNQKKLDTIEKFSLYVFLIQFILISITAPNDGITFTSRYHILGILPGLVLVNYLIKSFNKTKFINFLFIFSLIYQFFISIGFLLFFNEIKKFKNFAILDNPDTYITKNELACGSLGLEHLSKKIFCFKNNQLDFEKLKNLIDKGKFNKINFISEKTENLDIENTKKILLENHFTLSKESEYKTVKSFLFTR